MIKKIQIRNFRSIQELDFEPGKLCALVGPNSVGKTNIFRALDLVLGEGWATKGKVTKELFFNINEPIKILIEFTDPIRWEYYGKPKDINFITLQMEYIPEFKCEARLWESHPTPNGGENYYVNDEFKKRCHFIYIPSNRDLSDQMRVGSWTLLGKLMKAIYDEYVRTYSEEGQDLKAAEDKLKEEFKKAMTTAKDFLEKDFAEESITFKKFKDLFTQYCLENSAGLANKFMPELNIYNLNWFYKTLQIAVMEEEFTDKTFDSEEIGSGMQNLILLSIFQTYAELMGGNTILAIEEPEIYLYPQAQRELYRSFQKLSDKTQIFYTTHNTNFVHASRAYEVEILGKSKTRGTYNLKKDPYMSPVTAEKEKFRIYSNFNSERSEIFFAKKVLLVEGDSDKILWTTIAEEKYKININKQGISIIECGGKNGVVYFLGVCKLLGLSEYFAIWDEDDEKNNPTKDDLKLLPQAESDGKGLEIPGNLEKFLRGKFPEASYPQYQFTEDNKIQNAYEWAIKVDLTEIPTEFEIVQNFLLN